jgi:hypothetical protein
MREHHPGFEERAGPVVRRLKGIDTAIDALGGGKRGKVGHKMSAAARAKISATQKKNWAQKRGKK